MPNLPNITPSTASHHTQHEKNRANAQPLLWLRTPQPNDRSTKPVGTDNHVLKKNEKVLDDK